ncbi:hypothetical protein [Aquimarina pacifica]|uniref:hypothetical protein n=1 Tax=Aquimarina pacifica TaxID=1296415 RepID=UPI000472AE9F|nr:hypothetical protein [Aquimarina pacifica]
MKTIYRVLILGICLIAIQKTHAQFEEVKAAKAVGDNEEIGFSCFCNFVSNFLAFEQALAAQQANQQRAWLEGQESLLKTEIEERLNSQSFNTFEEAQVAFFRSYETNRLSRYQYYPEVKSLYEEETRTTSYGRSESKISQTALTGRLDDLNNEIFGIPAVHFFGDIAYEGQKIKNLSRDQLKGYINEETDRYNTAQNLLERRKKYDAQYAIAQDEDRFEDFLAQKYIDHYRSLSYESRIRFMTRHLIAHNSPSRYVTVMQYPFGEESTKFSIGDRDYTYDLKNLLSSIPASVIVDDYEIETTEAIYQQMLNSHVGRSGQSKINGSTSLNKYARGFFKNTNANAIALDQLTTFIGDYTSSRDFTPPGHQLLRANEGELLINDRLQPDIGVYANIDTEVELFDGVITVEAFGGIQHMMAVLFDGSNLDFEGGVIRHFLENNDMEIHPDITDRQLEQVFTITDASLLEYDFMVDYVLPFGREFMQDATSMSRILSDPLYMRAAVEIMRGADYKLREMVPLLMLSDELDFSYEQERWLINNYKDLAISAFGLFDSMEQFYEDDALKPYFHNLYEADKNNSVVSVSPLVKYPKDKAEQYKNDYPQLTEYLKNEVPKIANNETIINEIHELTDAPFEAIKEALQWGKGPEIIVQQLGGEGRRERYGRYLGHVMPEEINILRIDIDLVNDLENLKNSAKFREEIGFLIAVAILHEYNHLGDVVFGEGFWSDEFFEDRLEENEVGIIFEKAVFGETVWRSNVGIMMRNFGNW